MSKKIIKRYNHLSKLIGFTVLSLLFADCFASPKLQKREMLATFDLSIKGQQLRAQSVDLYFYLTSQPGTIYTGAILKPILMSLDVDKSPAFDFLSYEALIAESVGLHDASELNEKFTITPADTKFARLGMYGHSSEDKYYFSKAKNEDGNIIVLVYFDRACSISGKTIGNLVHDIHIPSKGLYQLRFKHAEGSTTVSVNEPPQKLFIQMKKMDID